MRFPDFSYEIPLWQKGFAVIGIDEVGRGAFAGPVGIGGVVFDPRSSPSQLQELLSLGINDSKKLTPKKRQELSLKIQQKALAFNTTFIDVTTINNIGIGKATFEGMKKVSESLIRQLQLIVPNLRPYLLIDAFEIPEVSILQKGIVRGDSLCISIAAASIIAKVERDKKMIELGSLFPSYAWHQNKGYGTLLHRNMISSCGTSLHHRVDFCKNHLPT